MKYCVEDGRDNCIKWFDNLISAKLYCIIHKDAKEIFKYDDNLSLIGCVYKNKRYQK